MSGGKLCLGLLKDYHRGLNRTTPVREIQLEGEKRKEKEPLPKSCQSEALEAHDRL